MQPTTIPQATPLSRNFSHPVPRPYTAPSPEHNQDNPPMAPNNSNIFLPRLPSALLVSRSEYNLHSRSNLQLDRDRYADFDFGYTSPPRRPSTAHTLTSRSVPDLTLTALPPPPLPLLPSQYQNQGLPPVNIQPPSPRRLVKSSPRPPTKSTRASKWRNVRLKIKRVFTFNRQKKRGSRETEDHDQTMQIGSPYDF